MNPAILGMNATLDVFLAARKRNDAFHFRFFRDSSTPINEREANVQ